MTNNLSPFSILIQPLDNPEKSSNTKSYLISFRNCSFFQFSLCLQILCHFTQHTITPSPILFNHTNYGLVMVMFLIVGYYLTYIPNKSLDIIKVTMIWPWTTQDNRMVMEGVKSNNYQCYYLFPIWYQGSYEWNVYKSRFCYRLMFLISLMFTHDKVMLCPLNDFWKNFYLYL